MLPVGACRTAGLSESLFHEGIAAAAEACPTAVCLMRELKADAVGHHQVGGGAGDGTFIDGMKDRRMRAR
jgi:hypothetical protein